MRKKICILLVATFLDDHRIIRKWGAYTEAGFSRTYAYNLWTGRFVNNTSQHMNLYKKQHLFWNHKESAKFNNTYMYRVWKETCTVLYLHSERIDRRNAWQFWQACISRECSVLLCNMYPWGHSWLASLIVTSF